MRAIRPVRLSIYRLVVRLLVLVPLRLRTVLYYRSGIWRVLRWLGRGLLDVVPAGPSGHRFAMGLQLDRHLQYAVGVYESDVAAYLARTLRPGDACIDAGAHFGYSSLLMARLVGSGGRVLALEPSPATLARLQENVAVNGFGQVTALAVAASDHEGEAAFFLSAEETDVTNSLVRQVQPESGRTVMVPVATLDALSRAELAGRKVRLVKIDVEGAEIAAIDGARDLLAEHRAVAVIEINRFTEADGVAVLARLVELDLEVEVIGTRHGGTVFVAARARP